MAHPNALTRFFSLLALSLLLVLAGCNEFDSAFGVGDDSWRTSDEFFTAQVGGSVGDGPIVNARLRVFSNSGRQLLETYSNDTADFDLRVRARGNEYPLTIVADQGIDIVTNGPPDFKLVSVIMKPGNGQIANLTPYSTLIVKAAEKGGGIDEETIAKATEAVVTRYGFGLNTDLVPDVLFSPMTDDNVHVMVKASETMGEMIRRTRDVMVISGTNLDGNDVVTALAADLTDGWIDGRGAEGHNPRIAAVANVASSAVMVEAMANRLHVYGVDATAAMDNTIRQVRPNAPASSNTRNVSISAEALDQSLRSLRAAKLVKNDRRIIEIHDAVAAAEPGATEFDVLSSGIQTMSSGFHNPLNDATLAVAYISDDAQLEELNKAASTRSDEDSSTRDEEDSRTNDDGDGTSDSNEDGALKDDKEGTSDGGANDEEGETSDTVNDDGRYDEGDSNTDGDSASDSITNDDEEPTIDDAPAILWSNDTWLLFDGVSDVEPTDLSLTQLSGTGFTAEAIIQYTGEGDRTWSPIFGSSEETFSHDQILNIGKVDGNNDLRVNIAGLGPFSVSGTRLFDGQERHVAVVVGPEEIHVYVDQTRIHTRDNQTGTVTASSDLLIGATGHAADERWLGWIGPARITAAALEPSQFLIADGSDNGEPLEPKPNTAPTIAGTPETSLVVGNPWS
ncbi:LamG-like jellyroll fold domain-containing protein, partial [Thioalkalivibrio sp.]|uniref:LamG-like jellyroll fold domain-containing protein n=1 Tax=Thioalkalivibrio sp. TaxID=2093813 RepID=UPI0035699AB7